MCPCTRASREPVSHLQPKKCLGLRHFCREEWHTLKEAIMSRFPLKGSCSECLFLAANTRAQFACLFPNQSIFFAYCHFLATFDSFPFLSRLSFSTFLEGPIQLAPDLNFETHFSADYCQTCRMISLGTLA